MKTSIAKYQNLIFILILLIVTIVFFWKFFLKGLLPIPLDLVSGTYFPWFDTVLKSFPSGIPVKNTALSDVVSIMYPWRHLAIDILKSGNIPFWNQYIFSGTPLLANLQSAPLYPLNFIYWLTDKFYIAWSYQVILQPFLAGIFMYLFLKNLRLNFLSCVFGSLVWSFSGFFMTWLEYNTLVHASLYLPLILYSIQKSVDDGRYCLLLTLALALSLYAGYPQITLYIIAFSILFILISLPRLKFWKYFLIALSMFLGVGLSTPFLLPAYEFNKISIRQEDKVAEASNIKYLPVNNLITFIAPDYFGNPTTRNYWPKIGSYENFVIFVGSIPFVLFIFTFFLNKVYKKILIFLWTTFIISLLLMIETPLVKILESLFPAIFSASVMGRLAIMTSFSIAVASSISLNELIIDKVKIKRALLPMLLTLVLIVFYIFKAIGQPYFSVSIRNLIFPMVIFLMSVILIYLLTFSSNKFKKYIVYVLIVFALIDLYRFSNKYNSFSSPELVYPNNPITNYLQSQILARFDHENGPILPSNTWMPYRLYSSSGQDAVHSLRYNKFINFVNTGKLIVPSRYLDIKDFGNKYVDFLGIKNLVVIKWKNDSPDFEGKVNPKFLNNKFTNVLDYGRQAILVNNSAMSRAFIVNSFVIAKTDKEFENVLNETDLSKTVVLEEVPEIKNLKGKTKINNLFISDTNIKIDIQSKGNSLLVMSESYLPDLKAYANGVEIPIYRANYTFIAIPIVEGNYQIEIIYYPKSFKYGLIIGGISLVLSVLIFVKFILNKLNEK